MASTNKNSFSLLPRDIASTIPLFNSEENNKKEDLLVYAHLFGVIGDWYICQISEDFKTAFGFKNIYSESEWEMDKWIKNEKDWGTFSIEYLQKLVNEEFLKEKDIRFLIVRDIYWKETKFSDLNIERSTLNYPGI